MFWVSFFISGFDVFVFKLVGFLDIFRVFFDFDILRIGICSFDRFCERFGFLKDTRIWFLIKIFFIYL